MRRSQSSFVRVLACGREAACPTTWIASPADCAASFTRRLPSGGGLDQTCLHDLSRSRRSRTRRRWGWGQKVGIKPPPPRKLKENNGLSRALAPRVGFEPTTSRLTAGCSTTELPRIKPRAWEQG